MLYANGVLSAQVENRGIIPSPSGYLGIINQRKQLKDVIWSCWPAVSAPSPHTPDIEFRVRPTLHPLRHPGSMCPCFIQSHTTFLSFVAGRGHHRQSGVLWAHTLCGKAAGAPASVLHDALDSHCSIPTSDGEFDFLPVLTSPSVATQGDR